jgi:NAD+ synthase (glutamine-hydrolysing)
MKISLAQLNYKIGDFENNTQKIIQTIRGAKSENVDLIVFSELSVCGYPPLDLLEHKYFIEQVYQSVEKISKECVGIAAIIGAPMLNPESMGKNLHNAALFCFDGKVQHTIYKTLLPTYDIFDEYRYFEPSHKQEPIDWKGYRIALTICEDLWFEQPIMTGFGKNKLYTINPLDKLAQSNPDFIINIAASPFAYNHDEIKREILFQNASKYSIPVFYVNQVGAHTEIIFDGGSRIVNSKGKLIHRLPFFKEAVQTFEMDEVIGSVQNTSSFDIPERIEKIHDALVLGIRDYFHKMGFTRAVLGLSGGIDSAVTLVLAVHALGNENVRVLLMPSQYSSDHSVNDAVALAENLNVDYDIISIKDIFGEFNGALSDVFEGKKEDITEENIQARIRGVLLMALSNKFGNILLNTSNKSEAAVGYGTLYGDMAGGISVLGDVYKSDVYLLSRYMNRMTEVIPWNTINKPPSAELRPDQKDSDSLPDYDILDKILFDYIELRKSPKDIISEGIPDAIVNRTIRLVNSNEYKRFQTPPILRVSSKAFGFGRRMPLVAKY